MPARRFPWLPAALFVAALALLYARPLASGFLNDDHLFLEEARSRPLLESLARVDPLANYVRPVSRQLWFAVLAPIAGGDARVFHAASALVFAAALVLLADLLAVFAPPIGVLAGLTYFALLPPTRVLLTWVSCSQDLLALLFALAALACFRRRRDGWATVLFAVAAFSKEAALPLPLVLAAWARWIDGDSWPRATRRVAPMGVVMLAWGAASLGLRARAPHAGSTLSFAPMDFVAGYVHALQTLVGLDTPQGWRDPLPHLLFGIAATASLGFAGERLLALGQAGSATAAPHAATAGGGETRVEAAPPGVGTARARGAAAGSRAIRLGTLWIAAFAFVVGPVAAIWSGYFYAVTAVGGALVVARLARGLKSSGWVIAAVLAVAVHAISVETHAFAIADDPWGWTSHLNAAYFDRAAALTDTLARQLREREPHPEPRTRFFFATLPPWAGFQMGNGALIRATYRDSSLRSYFYSQFSDSSAGWEAVKILYWDGRTLGELYDRAPDPWFQVGSDLLLFDRPAGAAHAFRRGLASGREPRFDLLYWLGWAELWQGHRAAAERAWSDAGMRDDTTAWFQSMRLARSHLELSRDTLAARRALAAAIVTGPGQPLPHALLGRLLVRERPKYGMLELTVATWLRPEDRASRRELVIALAAQRLDDQARAQLARLTASDPGWRSDPGLAATARTLDRRARSHVRVVQY